MIMGARGMTIYNLSFDMDLPLRQVYDFINGQQPVDRLLAERLDAAFKTGATFWLCLQATHDLSKPTAAAAGH